MASSNRHWPSMFKSKPSHHQWQHDVPNGNSNCHRPPYATAANSSGGLEDQRTPEPKPRWNPRPEQIRILEAIFNSGMVNPPRDEIRKIRAQLQEYGQVGDANVFYWFQNRKSRSKHKLRLQHINSKQHKLTSAAVAAAAPSSSSSSSSERSSPCNKAAAAACFSMGFNSPPHVNIDVSNNMLNSSSPTSASVNQTTSSSFFHALPAGQEELPAYFFPVMNNNGPVASANNNFSTTQGFWFSELANVVHVNTTSSPPDLLHGPCANLLLSEIMNNNNNNGMTSSRKNNNNDQEMMKGALKMEDHKLNYNGVFTSACSSSTTGAAVNVAVPSPMSSSHISAGLGGVGEGGGAGTGGGVLMGAGGAAKCMVFINDVAFEVAAGPFNVREAFGDDAVLIHSSGHPVLTNEWGVTLHSLHHGAFYYLI